jgi:indoleamine 2,3-dioxygenase
MGSFLSKQHNNQHIVESYEDIGFIPRQCNTVLPYNYKYLDYFLSIMHTYPNYRDELESYDFTYLVDQHNLAELSEPEVRNIYSICSILAHKYIWGDPDKPKNSIPQCLAKPWFDSSRELGIYPVITHAAIDLWNWKLKNPSKGFYLDNLESINTLSDGEDAKKSEEWFYLIMVAIEGECGELVNLFDKTMSEFKNYVYDFNIIYKNLQKIKVLLTHQNNLMSRMRENCKPTMFYNILRKYLWGSDKVEGGIRLLGVEKIDVYGDNPKYLDVIVGYGGGSAAQSSLIQAEDIFFGIKHPNDEFLKKMREYMPKKHRDYLDNMETQMNINQFINQTFIKINPNYDKLKLLCNECINLIADFRKIHKGVVTEYIINQIPKDVDDTGTGGTSLQSYLKEKVDETEKSKIN